MAKILIHGIREEARQHATVMARLSQQQAFGSGAVSHGRRGEMREGSSMVRARRRCEPQIEIQAVAR